VISLDLQKVIRKISVTFAMFLVGSYCITFAPGFNMTIVKGAILSVFIYPPLFYHLNDDRNYRYEVTKHD
jgi:hypothetical protein